MMKTMSASVCPTRDPVSRLPNCLVFVNHFFPERGKRTQGGLGLGLSVSHNLLQVMGGKIEVVSVPHKGSTVTVVRSPAPMTQMGTQTEGQIR